MNNQEYFDLQQKRKSNTLTTEDTARLQELCKQKLFELMESPEAKGVFQRLKNR